MLKVYATPPVGKIRVRNEQNRLNKNGIENVPTANVRNVLNRRRGGAGGRR